MSAAKLDGTKHVNDEGSEAVISYMQSHHNPAVELFAASFMEEWMKSPEKARDHRSLHTSDICTCTVYFRLVENAIEQFRHVVALTCELLVSFITIKLFVHTTKLLITPEC